MKSRWWMILLVLGAAACGGAVATTTSTTADPTRDVQAATLDLSGHNLEVHQAPG